MRAGCVSSWGYYSIYRIRPNHLFLVVHTRPATNRITHLQITLQPAGSATTRSNGCLITRMASTRRPGTLAMVQQIRLWIYHLRHRSIQRQTGIAWKVCTKYFLGATPRIPKQNQPFIVVNPPQLSFLVNTTGIPPDAIQVSSSCENTAALLLVKQVSRLNMTSANRWNQYRYKTCDKNTGDDKYVRYKS